jgi:hypothetical protein
MITDTKFGKKRAAECANRFKIEEAESQFSSIGAEQKSSQSSARAGNFSFSG